MKTRGGVLFLLFFFLISGKISHAASQTISPLTGTYAVGETITLTLKVNSTSSSINAVSGSLQFPSNLLQFVSASTASSIINIWVTNPSLVNGNLVRYEGVAFNPGYMGTGGKLFSATFKVIATGSATLSLTNASVLANDGQGSNVLTGTDIAHYTLGPTGALSTTPSVAGLPQAPLVISPTHPNPLIWYKEQIATFSWEIPQGVTAVAVVLDQNATTTPTQSKGLIGAYTSSKLSEGIYYAHVRHKNSGGWGDTTHYKLQIDFTSPYQLSIDEPVESANSAQATFQILAKDALAGIDHYDFSVDGSAMETVFGGDEITYTSDTLPPGLHTLSVTAYDRAGNITQSSKNFSITAIVAPVITHAPEEVREHDPIIVKGTSLYPGATLLLYVERISGDESMYYGSKKDTFQNPHEASVGHDGSFIVTMPGEFNEGIYRVYAKVKLAGGAESFSSNIINIKIRGDLLSIVMGFVARASTIVFPILGILGFLGALIWFTVIRVKYMKRDISKHVLETESMMARGFGLLDKDIEQQIMALQKVKQGEPVTPEEIAFLMQLRENLKLIDEVLEKEMVNISSDLGTPPTT